MSACNELALMIVHALGARITNRTAAQPDNWRPFASRAADISLRARMVDPWIEVTAMPTVGVPLTLSQAWSALRYNARRAGTVRLALTPGDAQAHLRGELYGCEADDLDGRIGALREDMEAAIRTRPDRGGTERSDLEADGTSVQPPAHDDERLVQLCKESGWPYVERASGHVEVCIDCTSASYEARLELTGEGALCAVIDLVDAAALSTEARSAIALVLLYTSAVVRSVKGVLTRRDGAECAGLAAACERPRSGADLDRALSALAVACGMAGREARALRHDALARNYLACHTPAFVDLRDRVETTSTGNNNQNVMEETPCLQQL